jgi:hypothetical protein
MSTDKIFCFGDGYAHGHIWPEWPQILQAMLPTHEVVIHTGIGAGNEFLIDNLLNVDCQNQTVIFQWAQPDRFDKLLQDTQWKTLAEQDPVYFFNFETNKSGTWWLSSASQSEKIQEYHKFFIQDCQAELRLKNQRVLVENYLQNKNSHYWFTGTNEQELFCQAHSDRHLRGTEIQPTPIMHFYFVIECIKPALKLKIDENLQQELKNIIESINWKPYDPERTLIWQDICKKIDPIHTNN